MGHRSRHSRALFLAGRSPTTFTDPGNRPGATVVTTGGHFAVPYRVKETRAAVQEAPVSTGPGYTRVGGHTPVPVAPVATYRGR